jgi:predicted  nucleic acid-binding Zn-ribbon protein
MEKVITLLKDLSVKVEAEGKEEAAEYDKYACFCKEQASDKLYAIEKSDKQIADLKAEISALDAAIAELGKEITDLSKKITDLEDEIKTKTEKREKEHEVYLGKAKDMEEAIEACEAAIEALRNSKAKVKEGGGKVDLAQVAKKVVSAISEKPVFAQAKGVVALLSKIEAAPVFEYQSNDIIATLESLSDTFKSMKKDLGNEEFDINSAFESDKLGLTNERKFAEKEKAEKEQIEQAKQERLQQATTDKDEETADRNSDQEFLDVLTDECQKKAEDFDQRSKTRAGELKAIAEATAELEKGAVPNWEANKKLVGIQKNVKITKVVAPTFVQIGSVKHEQDAKVASIQKVQKFLVDAVDRTHSGILSALALRVKVSEDHFVKVRALINDLIAKLEADATAEAEQKGICDEGMSKAIADRDEANAQIEAANAKITTETARKNALEDEIATLHKEIAELKKALNEATELRAQEKADNENTIKMSEEGAASVKLAMQILEKFYKANALLQGTYVPPKSDREGNTVGDLAPEVFSGKYKGAQQEATGIIGILEVMLSDFDRTTDKTNEDEKESEEAFNTFEKETNADIKKKDTRIESAEGELTEAKGNILEGQQELADAKQTLAGAEDKLEALKAMCVEGEETWEQRKQKRQEEIEALKEALAILEDWDK